MTTPKTKSALTVATTTNPGMTFSEEQVRWLKEILMDYKQIVIFSKDNAEQGINVTLNDIKEGEKLLTETQDPEAAKQMAEKLTQMRQYTERAVEDIKHLEIALTRRQTLYDHVLDFLKIKKTDDVDSLTERMVQEVHA